MKKNIIIVTIIICILLTLSACGIQDKSSGMDKTNIASKQSSVEISKTLPAGVKEKSNFVSNNTQPSNTSSTKITTRDLKQYLTDNKTKIIKSIEKNAESGTESIMESHMVFPCIFAKDIGLTFIFQNEIDDKSPLYICINEATNVKNVDIKGARPGMNFKNIISKLGKSKVEKTWFSNEDNLAYVLDYKIDGVVYSFVSYNEDGTDSDLYISLDSDK